MVWEPFALALAFGLLVSAALYFIIVWPAREPQDMQPPDTQPPDAQPGDAQPSDAPPAASAATGQVGRSTDQSLAHGP